jgi:parallel beta-helix repeat protein
MFFDIPSMDAITISKSENVNVTDCFMSDSIEKSKSGTQDRYISGITLEGGCYNTTILGNIISNASYAGIIVLKGCNNTKIIGNYIHSNEYYGIRAQQCNNIFIERNMISNNRLIGIAIVTCKNAFITRNSCEHHKNSGVGISDSACIHVTSNNFMNNGIIGHFSYNFGKEYANILPDIIWAGNFWDRPRITPKLIFGTITFQKDAKSCILIFPWVNVDWNPAKEPYDI